MQQIIVSVPVSGHSVHVLSFDQTEPVTGRRVKAAVRERCGVPVHEQRLVSHSDIHDDFEFDASVAEHHVRVCLRVCGGKGGFGALLRATKTAKVTDFSHCRDLNGRRLGEVEREQQLAEWYAQEEERRKAAEAENAEKEREKQTKTLSNADQEFAKKSNKYFRDVSAMTASVSASVRAAMAAESDSGGSSPPPNASSSTSTTTTTTTTTSSSSASTTSKRKFDDLDDLFGDDFSDEEEEEQEEVVQKKKKKKAGGK